MPVYTPHRGCSKPDKSVAPTSDDRRLRGLLGRPADPCRHGDKHSRQAVHRGLRTAAALVRAQRRPNQRTLVRRTRRSLRDRDARLNRPSDPRPRAALRRASWMPIRRGREGRLTLCRAASLQRALPCLRRRNAGHSGPEARNATHELPSPLQSVPRLTARARTLLPAPRPGGVAPPAQSARTRRR